MRSIPVLLSLLTLASLVSIGTPPTAAESCKNPQTQMMMNQCEDQAAAASAKLVAAALTKLENTSPHQKALIDKSQRAFVAYRAAACAVDGDQVKGGSMEDMQVSACQDTLNKQRLQTLEIQTHS